MGQSEVVGKRVNAHFQLQGGVGADAESGLHLRPAGDASDNPDRIPSYNNTLQSSAGRATTIHVGAAKEGGHMLAHTAL